jgi:nicotinamidase-related amidase
MIARPSLLPLVLLSACAGEPVASNGGSGEFVLRARSRKEAGAGRWEASEATLRWEGAKTAVIVCDMWDDHNCKSAARRVAEMVPRFNEFLRAARAKGATIFHCPSDVVKFYDGTPQRERIKAAARVEPPTPIKPRPYDATCEGAFPFDNAQWGCDDQPQCPIQTPYPWTRQHKGIEIAEADLVTDNGQEVWNWCQPRGIVNVIVTGVHTNYCVVGRSFGIRQMKMLGRNVVLVRDLTDSLYNPRNAPHVTHARGTELVVEHVEKYWCPSVLSRDVVGR